MRTLTDEAIVLEVVDLHEQDRIVSLLTRHHGLKRGVARSARRKYSRFAGELQPFGSVQATWFERDDRDLVRVRSVELTRSGADLYDRLEDVLVASYVAEHAKVFAPENLSSEPLFRLTVAAVDALLDELDRDVVSRYVEVWVLRLAGIFPAPDDCPVCGRPITDEAVLAPGADGLTCRDCSPEGPGTIVADAEVLEVLQAIGRTRLPALAANPPPARALRRVEAICREVRRGFLGAELKSWNVMQSTLGGLDVD